MTTCPTGGRSCQARKACLTLLHTACKKTPAGLSSRSVGSYDEPLKIQLEKVLGELECRRLQVSTEVDAGVLMPILDHHGVPSFLLTKRTESVSTHKGQVSFPGGLREAQDDSLVATALRESEEEVGLPPARVEIIGAFHEYQAVTGVRVLPFVGWVKGPANLKPNPEEVERILVVPIRFFCETQPRIEMRERGGIRHRLYFYEFQDETIWGLTAGIIKDFVQVLLAAGGI